MTPSSQYVSYETTFPANAGPITTKIGTITNGSMILIDDDVGSETSAMKARLQSQFYRLNAINASLVPHDVDTIRSRVPTMTSGGDDENAETSSQSTLLPHRASIDNEWTITADDKRGGDVVRQFCDHRRKKIRDYVNEFTRKYPVPLQCTVERSKGITET